MHIKQTAFRGRNQDRIRQKRTVMRLLLAGESSGNQQEQHFINNNRCIAVEKTIDNTAADNCRNAAKHKYPQFSADVHLLSPIGPVSGKHSLVKGSQVNEIAPRPDISTSNT